MLVVNCRFLSQKITGTQKFAIEICREIKKQNHMVTFVSNPNIMHQEIAHELGVKIIGSKSHKWFKSFKLPSGLLWEQLILPFYLKKHYSDAQLLNLVNLAPIMYKNNYVVLHDVAYKVFPHFFKKIFLLLYNTLVPIILRKARCVFTVSHFSASEIIKYYPYTKGKIEVVYNAIDDIDIETLPQNGKKYILAVGSLEPRKNLIALVKAFQQRDDKNIKLIIVGEKNSKVFNADNTYDFKDDNIVFTGYINEDDKNALYAGASVFVYPSLYEGFGIPPLEAQAIGIPVILSDIKVFKEIYMDSVLYVNPDDSKQLMDKIQNVISNEELRKSLIEKGYENIKRYSWSKSANKILQCMK